MSGDHRDDRCHPGNDWRVKVVRQVRQNRDVLLFRRRQVCRREAQNAAEDEEHHGQHHHDVGAREDTGAFLLSAFAVLFTFGYREGRDDRRVVEGERPSPGSPATGVISRPLPVTEAPLRESVSSAARRSTAGSDTEPAPSAR